MTFKIARLHTTYWLHLAFACSSSTARIFSGVGFCNRTTAALPTALRCQNPGEIISTKKNASVMHKIVSMNFGRIA